MSPISEKHRSHQKVYSPTFCLQFLSSGSSFSLSSYYNRRGVSLFYFHCYLPHLLVFQVFAVPNTHPFLISSSFSVDFSCQHLLYSNSILKFFFKPLCISSLLPYFLPFKELAMQIVSDYLSPIHSSSFCNVDLATISP